MSSWTRSLCAAAVVLLLASLSPAAPRAGCQSGQGLSKRLQAAQLRGIISQQNYRLTTSQFRVLTSTYQAIQQTPQVSATDIQAALLQQNPQLTDTQLQVFTAILQTAQQQTAQLVAYQQQSLVQQQALLTQRGSQGRGCAAGHRRVR